MRGLTIVEVELVEEAVALRQAIQTHYEATLAGACCEDCLWGESAYQLDRTLWSKAGIVPNRDKRENVE